ncbi:FecR/PupR family sigma factor regulator [Steroidobacter flavus]|uniref:FecR/PupR family sigma factor regulator n=1 Tax=Steroidobacter flavus TaxID=1842136 RepID=A0ABV8T6X1_9GAMM
MTDSGRDDPAWDLAWEWIVREHEQPLDAAARQQLTAWLNADPSHLRAYQQAAKVWLIAGLVPPPPDSDPPA